MNKFRVSYVRDGLVEEVHEGYFIKSTDKETENNKPYYLRSCAKPLQATLLVDYKIDLTPQELALCCGSHAGEDIHINTQRSI